MKIALVTIATGDTYRGYAREMMNSAAKYMPAHDQFTFTDDKSILSNSYIYTHPKGFPRETLMRYHTILTLADRLAKYDQLFWVDADMLFVAPVGDIFADGLVATLHHGYVGKRGTPETRRESTAFCDNNTAYYAGGFQGGKATDYLNAAINMSHDITADDARGITAVWHDESHWNAWLASHPPAKVLSPSYCFHEGYSVQEYQPILMALDKRKRGNHPRFK